MKIPFLITIFTISLCLFLLEPIHSQQLNQSGAIIYKNCSSTFCEACLNPYQCLGCSVNYAPACCPKFCSKCIDMDHCIQCELYFVLYPYGKGIYCQRVSNLTDPYTNPYSYDPLPCINGYYLEPVTQSCLSCNVTNCVTCTSYQVCSQCLQGYFLFNSTKMNPLGQYVRIPVCVTCGVNCVTCSNQSVCVACAGGYFLLSTTGACVMCSQPFCYACPDNVCSECITGAYLIASNHTCQLCAQAVNGCAVCTASTPTPKPPTQPAVNCTQCSQTFYLTQVSSLSSSFNCTACPQFCNNCYMQSSILTCDSCYLSYFWNNNTNRCQRCDLVGCLFCAFKFNTNEVICELCDYAFFAHWNPENQSLTCKQCGFPCMNCTNFMNTCMLCYPGFYLDYVPVDGLAIGQCYFCNITNCITCESSTQCTLCSDGFYLSQTPSTNGYTCAPCLDSCIQCTVQYIPTFLLSCILCDTGFVIVNNTCQPCNPSLLCQTCYYFDVSDCSSCNPGYMLNYSGSSIHCSPCGIEWCGMCGYNIENNIMCNACVDGYFLVTNNVNQSSCEPCGANCLNCANNSYCNLCAQQFYLSINTTQKQSTCHPCPPQCLSCTSQGCLLCTPGFYPSIWGNVLLNDTITINCTQCTAIPGCFDCFNTHFCRVCSSIGYSTMPDTLGQCTPCPYGCVTCDDAQVCSECAYGFLINFDANECLQQIGLPIWAIFSCCSLGVAIIFVVGEKVVRAIGKKRRLKKEQREGNDDIMTQLMSEEPSIMPPKKQSQHHDHNKNHKDQTKTTKHPQ